MASLSSLLLALSLMCRTVTNIRYDSIDPRRSVVDIAGPVKEPGYHADYVIEKSKLDPKNAAHDPINSASKVVNSPNDAVNSGVNDNKINDVQNDLVQKIPNDEIALKTEHKNIKNIESIPKPDDRLIGINLGSRRSDSNVLSSEAVKAMVIKKISDIDKNNLYNLTNNLIKNLNWEYNGLAHVTADNNNNIKYAFSIVEYFNLELTRILASHDYDTYADAHKKALEKVKKLKFAKAVQLAAPVRRVADIFRAIIATQIELVQAACSVTTPNCNDLYTQKLLKEVTYCPNIVHHSLLFLNTLTLNNVQLQPVSEKKEAAAQGERLKRSKDKSNSQSRKNHKQWHDKSYESQDNIRHKRDQIENKPLVPIPQVLGNVAEAVKTVASDQKYVSKTVEGVAQRVIGVPKTVLDHVGGLLDQSKRRKRAAKKIVYSAEKSVNNAKVNDNPENAAPNHPIDNVKPGIGITSSIVEPLQTTTEKDKCTEKTEQGKLFDYILLQIEQSLEKNKIILLTRAKQFALVKEIQKWNMITCFDIDRDPALDELVNLN